MTEFTSSRDDLPDVTSTGINNSAKMVWEAVQATPSFVKYSTSGKNNGTPGRYWQGAVNSVINDLWPALNDRYLTEKEQSEELKLALNRFLRANRVMICIRDGGVIKKSTWFIATYWPELTVTPGTKEKAELEASVVTDAAATAEPIKVTATATPLDVFNLSKPMAPAITATEVRSEEAMTPTFQEPTTPAVEDDDDDVIQHECRLDGCELKFEGIHHRATHEMRHGFRYNEDGTVTHFDVNDPVPDEEAVQELIAKVCKDQEAMTRSQIVEAVRKAVPKASSPTIKIVLEVMTDEGWFELVTRILGNKGRHRRYEFRGEPSKAKKKAAAKPLAMAVEEKTDDLIARGDEVDGGFMETAAVTLRGDADGSRIDRYRGLLNDLAADLSELDKLRTELAKERAVNADLQKNIDTVIAERDALQGKLDTLKQVFGSALQ